jgi:alpha-glucoside transport system substrate-binding protein
MQRRMLAISAVVLVFAAVACSSNKSSTTSSPGASAGGKNTGKVTVFNAMQPYENTAAQEAVDKLITPKVAYKATLEASSSFEEQAKIRIAGGNPPDVIMYPQPGSVVEQAKAGKLVALEDIGFDLTKLSTLFGGDYLLSLGEYNGKHYGIPTNVNLKSMVWYPKDDFDKKGYKVPTTWDELIALSNQIKADGGTPWCVGFESGTATGWPATDWMEDIMLRTAGVDTYDKWVKHEVLFTDPAVKKAAQLFGQIMFTPGYVLGGADKTPSISFASAPLPMFKEPPGCWLHRQASFIIGAAPFPSSAKAGVDYDWFPFPPIDQQGTLIAGELSAITRNAPEVKDYVERFIAEDVQCAQGGDIRSSRLSPNVNVQPSCYANQILADSAKVVSDALKGGYARFDASDQMPSAVGSGAFWTDMVKYVQQGPSSLDGLLADIDKAWPA